MDSEKNNQPLAEARREELVIQELPDEVLVYDLRQHKAHMLNQTAAFVWNHCDGQTTVAEMAAMLEREFEKPVSEDVVWLALKQLSKANLLQEQVAMPGEGARVSRRQAMRKLGTAAALTLPLVISVVAPMAAAAATIPEACITCTTGTAPNMMCPPVCDGSVIGLCYANNSCQGIGSPFGCTTCEACKALSAPPARSWRAGAGTGC